MSDETVPTAPLSVPEQVFSQFVDALKVAKVPDDIVERMRKTLLDDRALSERALRNAILPEEVLP